MISSSCPLLLGSASPRRRSILESLGISIVVLPGDALETVLPGEAPTAYLERIALDKLAGVRALCGATGLPRGPVSAILVADTIVVIDDQIVGKPEDAADAVTTLNRLVGRTHTVLTRYVLAEPGPGPGGVLAARTVKTAVKLREATPEEVRGYAATGEGLDKAGAYAAQGIGAFLVEAITGSYSNVVGLPACELVSDLLRHGLLPVFPVGGGAG